MKIYKFPDIYILKFLPSWHENYEILNYEIVILNSGLRKFFLAYFNICKDCTRLRNAREHA